ncbi:MAG: mechanosensitive ion channel [Anaerolineae bacterium]|jgi:small conductance mechanosensitive channel|nr:mechanosensitive ion channel [Anaerolineae bacterium]MBT3711848.1 mechanosensitive ion channel [Anaerolineae bacterium]MBT7188996.1 mechanosensitive ion channel [Anaerolineae bacterium]MBT7990263.1 mechanosensitive ion channel [Anaerolineae bacterium]
MDLIFFETLPAIVPEIGIALLIFIGSLFLAKFLRSLLDKMLKTRGVDPETSILLGQLLYWSILIFGIITALQRFFDVSAFLAGLGILGFTIGFALQEIMQNFVAGMILLVQQPFDIGNFVSVSSYSGNVTAINMRTTELKTLDGRLIIIPNAQVLSNPIENYSRADLLRVDLPVGVSYDTDLDLARAAIMEALPGVKGFLPEPAPSIIYHSFGDSSINMDVRFWINTSENNLFDAKDEAVIITKRALDAKGVDIPFPIRTVYMQK